MKNMKKLTMCLVAALVAGLGFYNLQLSKSPKSTYELSFVENSASADEEEDMSKFYSATDSSGHQKNTTHRAGKPDCYTEFDYAITTCAGKGSVDCTASSTVTNLTTDC
jgi:hypothetical protein